MKCKILGKTAGASVKPHSGCLETKKGVFFPRDFFGTRPSRLHRFVKDGHLAPSISAHGMHLAVGWVELEADDALWVGSSGFPPRRRRSGPCLGGHKVLSLCFWEFVRVPWFLVQHPRPPQTSTKCVRSPRPTGFTSKPRLNPPRVHGQMTANAQRVSSVKGSPLAR